MTKRKSPAKCDCVTKTDISNFFLHLLVVVLGLIGTGLAFLGAITFGDWLTTPTPTPQEEAPLVALAQPVDRIQYWYPDMVETGDKHFHTSVRKVK